eukprot:SAG31_NODE_2174_length_6257_cov_1.750244_5_plen_77_part_00
MVKPTEPEDTPDRLRIVTLVTHHDRLLDEGPGDATPGDGVYDGAVGAPCHGTCGEAVSTGGRGGGGAGGARSSHRR